VLAEHGGDLPPAVDSAQLYLPARYETEEQDQRGVFVWQRALCFHTPPKFLMEPFDHVRASQCLPLCLREGEELATLAPCAFEARVGGTSGIGIRSVNDAMEVVADLGAHMLRGFPLKIAQLVDTTALHGRP